MRDTILVALDLGDATDAVVAYAERLASDLYLGIHLMHVGPLLLHRTFAGEEADGQVRALRRLQGIAADLCERTGSEVSLTYSLSDEPAADLLAAAAGRAALTIVGQSANRGLWRFLSASVTRDLIGAAPSPILVVPAGIAYLPPERVVLAVDERPLPREELLLLRRVVDRYGSALTLVHQDDRRGERPGADFADALYDTPYSYHYARSQREVGDFVYNAIREESADWIAVTHHVHRRWRDPLTASTAKRLADRSYVPVLVLPDRSVPGQPARSPAEEEDADSHTVAMPVADVAAASAVAAAPS